MDTWLFWIEGRLKEDGQKKCPILAKFQPFQALNCENLKLGTAWS